MKVWRIDPWVAVRRPLGDGACGIRPRAKENEHGDQASLPPGKAHMEDKGTGRRVELHLSGLREDARQAATGSNGWLRSPVVAWNWLVTCRPARRRRSRVRRVAAGPRTDARGVAQSQPGEQPSDADPRHEERVDHANRQQRPGARPAPRARGPRE